MSVHLLFYTFITLPGGERKEEVLAPGNVRSRFDSQEFPGGPVARTQRFQCCGPGLNPWSGS